MTATDAAHIARVLLLVNEFSEPGSEALDGLTKLAKLDFLLRYPAFLEALNERNGVPADLLTVVRDAERLAVDSPMIRYKYGPWDDRYYALIGALVGRGFVEYADGRGRASLRVTDSGRRVASDLAAREEWTETAARLKLLREHYDLPGSRLKNMIYDAFPAIRDVAYRSVISANPEFRQ